MAEDFKYLGGNPGTSDMPFTDYIDVQKTVTDFNYNLWGATTKLYLKHVPACWGSDYEHVVQFADTLDRDIYFKADYSITLETAFRIPHDGIIRLPIPYDTLINFNYIMAEYPNAPVPGYDVNKSRKQYFYFIEDCSYVAANTTEVKIELDIWTTYLSDIEVSNMQLERGHLPMTFSDVDSYLENPLNNRIGLGTIDVNFGDLCKVSENHKYDLTDGDTFVVVASKCNWDTTPHFVEEDPNKRNCEAYHGDGAFMEKGVNYFAIESSDWSSFIQDIRDYFPAFVQNILGVMVINTSFVPVDKTQYSTWKGHKRYTVIGGNADIIDYTFTKEDFGFGHDYDWITKLYTYPYSAVEFIDQNGSSTMLKFEDFYAGKFAMRLFNNLCVNNPSSKAILLNVGGYQDDGDFNMYSIDIQAPSSIANLNAHKAWLNQNYYPRVQQTNSINNSYNNGLASLNNSKTQSLANATLSSNISKRGNDQAKDFATHDISKDETLVNSNIDQNKKMSSLNMLSIQCAANANLMNENASYATTGSGTIMGTANTLATGAMSAALGANAMSVPAVACGVINQSYNFLNASALFDIAATMIRYNLATSLEVQNAISGAIADKTFTLQSVDKTITYDLQAQEGLINLKAAENFATTKTNTEYKRDEAYRVSELNRTDTLSRNNAQINANYNVSKDILDNNKQLGLDGMTNAENQSYYNAIQSAGSPGDVSRWNDETSFIQYRIKTQSDEAIRSTGDYFLRYGYAYSGNCQALSFNVMRYFTYWKCQEVWLYSNNANNKVLNKFKEIFKRGVTVWRNPEDMGNISIYDNTIYEEL